MGFGARPSMSLTRKYLSLGFSGDTAICGMTPWVMLYARSLRADKMQVLLRDGCDYDCAPVGFYL